MLHQLSKEVPNRDEIVKHNRLTSYDKNLSIQNVITISVSKSNVGYCLTSIVGHIGYIVIARLGRVALAST